MTFIPCSTGQKFKRAKRTEKLSLKRGGEGPEPGVGKRAYSWQSINEKARESEPGLIRGEAWMLQFYAITRLKGKLGFDHYEGGGKKGRIQDRTGVNFHHTFSTWRIEVFPPSNRPLNFGKTPAFIPPRRPWKEGRASITSDQQAMNKEGQRLGGEKKDKGCPHTLPVREKAAWDEAQAHEEEGGTHGERRKKRLKDKTRIIYRASGTQTPSCTE